MSFPFKPKIAGWELTRRCNYNCLHCGTSCGAPRDDEMSFERAMQMIDELADLGCEIINLSGGEPLMHPHWDKFATKMKERNITPYMITNGYYIEEQLERILNSPLRRIGISVDGDEEIHNHIRQNDKAYERVISASKLLKKHGLSVGAISHVSKYNLPLLEHMYSEFLKIPMDFWQIQITFASGRMKDHSDRVLEPEQLIQVAEFMEEKRKEKKMMVCVGDNLGYYSQYNIVDGPWKGCHAGRWVAGIEADGTIKGCLSLPPEFHEMNLKEHSFKDIWENTQSFKYNRYFNPEDMSGSCKDCEKSNDCRGGCRVTAFNTTGNIYDNPYCLFRVEKETAKKS